MRKGQISFFILIGLTILIFAALWYLFGPNNNNTTLIVENSHNDFSIVQKYAETCVKNIGNNALFEFVGMQGGYISLESFTQNAPYAIYNDNLVPIYAVGSSIYSPGISLIENQISQYVSNEFRTCIEKAEFEEKGINIEHGKIIVSASSNSRDLIIKVENILKASNFKSTLDLSSLSIMLPIRLKELHETANLIVDNALSAQPDKYNISRDCEIYDKNGYTNIYVREIGSNEKVIQLVDFSTYFGGYLNSYVFQFALKDVAIEGSCA